MKCVRRICAALSLFACFITLCVDLAAAEKDRPRVGVVLSGGGAKGFAHIALLRRLEELGIPVDYIGGTSMGATIAALYAIGYTPDELEHIARDTGWTSLFMEKPDRNDRDIFSKTILQEFPIAANITEDIISPKGLVSGQNISSYLSRLTAGYQGYRDFGEFRIPFICIGTDMETGEQAVFREGDIVNSLRASMAIPTVFEPVKIDDHIYLDGGIVNNFPVREVRESGADIIIGVDVGAPLYTAREMTNFPKIVNQLISFNGMKRNEAQRDACDILIIPNITEFDAMSFDRTDDIIKEGKKAVDEQSNALVKLSERLKSYHVTRDNGKIVNRQKKIRVDRIEFDNVTRGSEKIARSLCSLKEGDKVTIDDIEKNVRYLYGTNYFNTVEYRIEQLENETVLRFTFDEKSEKRLYAGFSYDNYMKGALYLGFEANRLLLDSAKAYVKVRVGNFWKVDGGYYIYTSLNPGFMILLDQKLYKLEFTDKSSSDQIDYDFMHESVSAGIGGFVSNWFLMTAGVRKDVFNITMTTRSGKKSDANFDNFAAFGSLKIDTFNEYHFPTSGILLETFCDYVYPNLSVATDRRYRNRFFHMIENLRCALPLFDRVSPGFGGSIGMASRDDVPPAYLCAVGGSQYYEKWVFPLEGYEPFELVGQHGWMCYAQIQCRIFDGLYVTPKWNTGKTGGAIKDVFNREDMKTGYGLKVGYNFYLGPIELGFFKKHRVNDYTLYFNLGFVY